MYVVILNEVFQPVAQKEQETLPEAYGPYDSMFEATGAAVDFIRTGYDNEPWMKFEGFGDNHDCLKIIVKEEGGDWLAATINKMY